MAKVFIVRPFGERSILKKDEATGTVNTLKYNFDTVEKDLIRPAMKKLDLSGGTTGEVIEAGDIREDMFSELLLADIVIADISIYNPNVFYELGIRHALRDRMTILIKCRGFDDTPFDILTYRYFTYDKNDPGAGVDDLAKFIYATMQADDTDSPVFDVLPQLQSHDPEKYLAVPPDFTKDVFIAKKAGQAGKLSLLAAEADSFTWRIPGSRLVGEALFRIKAFEAARIVWEKVHRSNPLDREANDRLATVYQRLAEEEMITNPNGATELLVKSDLAIEELVNNKAVKGYDRAEAYALKGRNAKTRWLNSWKSSTNSNRIKTALQSVYLETATMYYEKGFHEDLNHFYSGINALGLLITRITLAEKDPVTWECAFDTTEAANQELKELKIKCQKLTTTLQVSIEAAKGRLEAEGEPDPWVKITEADFTCLTSARPERVSNIYTRALQDAPGLNMEATIRQLKIYELLEVRPENVRAALEALPAASSQNQASHYLLFTGHMIDKPERKEPRFPPAKEAAVRQRIKEKVLEEKNKADKGMSFIGIAGGACGGDILFHEVCAELRIPTRMFLALPREQFIVESVAFAGSNWIERFNNLYRKLPHPVLSEQKELPKWLHKKEGYDIWTRNNLWELNSALENGGLNMTLIALWDGKGGDGPGGTADMVKEAKARGSNVMILDINSI